MRKTFYFVIIAAVILFLSGCKPIEDINGNSNKTLATITDTRLAQSISGSISTGNSIKTGSPSIQRASDAGGMSDSDYDYDNIEFEIRSLNGTQKAMVTYLMKGQSLTISFASTIDEGNFAAVLLSTSKTILKKFEADNDETFKITADTEGDYFLVIAGESAKGKLKIYRTIE